MLKKKSKFIICIDAFTYSNYEAFCSLLEVWLSKTCVSLAFYLFMVQMKWKRNCNTQLNEGFLKAS